MKINEMFVKDIHRNIEGVITASQSNDEQMYQELDEYVVTKELQTHFKSFFDAYKKGIAHETSKMGVWIQGFFGSGKSHFLKILSYILENREINGKTALSFFTEGSEDIRKIKDDMTIADMRLATGVPTSVILFNIESKHQTGVEEKNSLVNVFLKVFNDSLGYSTIPHLADLERNLDKQGKYIDFKETFESINGEPWLDSRHEVDFLEDEIVEALVAVGYFSESAARNWFAKTENEYKISIEEFAILVEEYLKEKGNDHHIVFLVDEVGQYIGGNRSLTLQLQTIVEELGNKSRGKAWVIVTSQELIDAVTDISGTSATDFSKIKGRFETTLSLSSAHADEVIQKRILQKNQSAQNYLQADYPNNENNIKSMLQFEDSPELKLYADSVNYADVYPFIPYQFNLLSNILTEISRHSIQGTNLSRGERSLLAFFKETAERNADKDNGVLVSLDQFYPSLEKWLNETRNDAVIKRALENSKIVPDPDDTFNVDVLKVLFMIKYVDQHIKPTINNITNLMVRHVNEDKLELRNRVDNALKILISQNLIRQNLKSYIFQTDEEQEVSRLINNMELNNSDVEDKLAKDIFDDKVGKNSITLRNKHSLRDNKKFENRYSFSYNRYIDDYSYGSRANPQIEVKIITPLNEELSGNETQLIISSSENLLLIDLPLDTDFMNGINNYLRVERYISTNISNPTIKNFAILRSEKSTENQELNASLKNQLDDLLRESTFYYKNNILDVTGSDFKAKLNDALQQVLQTVYHKNDLVDSPITESDINNYLSSTFNDLFEETRNNNVLDEVQQVIKLREIQGMTITLKDLRDKFIGAEPYGFINEDLEWVIARLFKESKISIIKNGIPLANTDNVRDVSKAIFERRSPEKIIIKLKKQTNPQQKKLVKELALELFDSKNIVDETNDDVTMSRFIEKTKMMIREFDSYKNNNTYKYPQNALILENLNLLNKLIGLSDSTEFFESVAKNEEKLLDWSEDLVSIRQFHTKGQKAIWEKAKSNLNLMKENTIYDNSTELEGILNRINQIINLEIPYREIPELGRLNDEFQRIYTELLEIKSKEIKEEINDIEAKILEDRRYRNISETFDIKINKEFSKLKEELSFYQTFDKIALTPMRANILRDKYTREFDQEENRLRLVDPKIEPEQAGENDKFVKTKETVHIKKLMDSKKNTKIKLENREDVDLYIESLKELLLKELDNNKIINL